MKEVNQGFDQQGRKFWGTEHFPYGLSRSGEFTREQVQLLENHGHAYRELATSVRQPVTPEEKAFVAFCQGEKPAESHHEKVWDRFQKKAAHNAVFISLGSSSNDEDITSAVVVDMDDF